MAVTFQKEPFWLALTDAQPLLPRHYDEIAEDKTVIGPIDPDLESYSRLYEANRLHCMTARDDGKLVGFYVVIISQNLHYRSVVVGSEDLYYLAPEYRKGATGIRLFVEAERMMRELGVMVAIAKTKEAHSHGPIFERLGWRAFERVYCKTLVA